MGNNGSGKTTLIKCLLGLEPFYGTIKFNNKKLQEVRSDICVIYDDIPLYPELSGFHNIRLLVSDLRRFNYNTILNFNLLSKKKLQQSTKNYSLGERKKLAILAAMLSSPKFLIVDEISNGLDLETLEILKKNLIHLKKDCLILATGHHLDFYEQIVDDLLILHNHSITQLKDFLKGGISLNDIYTEYLSGHQ
jgi:ABC-2 type transport system ATP-binding protein